MPTIGQLIAQAQVTATAPAEVLIVHFDTATATSPDVSFVNASNRTPAAGQNGVLIRTGGVFFLLGLF